MWPLNKETYNKKLIIKKLIGGNGKGLKIYHFGNSFLSFHLCSLHIGNILYALPIVKNNTIVEQLTLDNHVLVPIYVKIWC